MEEFLFPVGDEKLLAQKMVQFLSLREEEVIIKRILSFQYAQGFSKGRRDEAYFTLYNRVISSHRQKVEVSNGGN
jgi:hypothetical protein